MDKRVTQTAYSLYARQSPRHAWRLMGHGTDYLDTLCRSVYLIVDVEKSWPEGQVAMGAMQEQPGDLPKASPLDVLYPTLGTD